MKSMRGLRVVVVIDSEHGHILAARLRRMEVAQVTAVAGLEEARLLCQSGNADACLVAVDAPVPDAVPAKESDTPGRWCGVPALMLAPVVTPHLRQAARRRGYLAAISATTTADALSPSWRSPSRPSHRASGAALACTAHGQPFEFGRFRQTDPALTLPFSLIVSDFDPEGVRHEDARGGAEPHRPGY
jgi:hypothetical protein